jgi:glycosyltransferase involved in cell wall biosynthesis
LARVARSVARAFAENDRAHRYDLLFAGPIDRLESLGARDWGQHHPRLIRWNSGRLSARAELDWPRVRDAVGDAVWYFPHFDVPWRANPRQSIVVIHDLIALHVPGATTAGRKALAERWIRRSGRRATRIVVGSEFTRREVSDQWPDLAHKIVVVPHGVDPLFFAPPARLPDDLDRLTTNGPFMLSVGNKKPHKNLVMGPEVLARLPDLRWVVVGEPFRGWEQVTRLIAELGVGDRVHILDPQPDAVLHALYAASACLFFPSRHEGFGLPILEALAAGTRVVVGAAGASIEVLAGHGAVCDLDDANSFATAVDAALKAHGLPDPAARAHAATFTWSRAARQIAGLMEEIANQG